MHLNNCPVQTCHKKKEHRDHPEDPNRIVRIFETIEERGLLEQLVEIPCRQVTAEEVESCHTKSVAVPRQHQASPSLVTLLLACVHVPAHVHAHTQHMGVSLRH